MFNPREQALIIWLIIFLVYVLSIKDVRSSIPSVIKSFLRLFRHPIFILTNLYIVIVFSLLYLFEVLDSGVFKDYVIWIFSALYPLIYRVSTKYFEESAWKIMKETFKFSIIPMFIISEYTLSIWAELFIIPIVAFITGLLVLTDSNEKYHQLKKLLNFIIYAIAIIYIIFGLKGFISNLSDASKIDFWEKVFIDFIGVFVHFPLLFSLQYASIYEQIIIRTKLEKKTQKLLALSVIFSNMKLNKQKLLRSIRNYKLLSVETVQELKECLHDDSMRS